MKKMEKVDLSGFKTAQADFKKGIDRFNYSKTELFTITEALLATWRGEGRKEYELEYTLLRGKFNDLTDSLYEIYNALTESEAAYIESDEKIAKMLTL